MDFIRPIGPVERDIDPAQRVERLRDERERREQERKKRRPPASRGPQPTADGPQGEGPTEGDDGHLHIDVQA